MLPQERAFPRTLKSHQQNLHPSVPSPTFLPRLPNRNIPLATSPHQNAVANRCHQHVLINIPVPASPHKCPHPCPLLNTHSSKSCLQLCINESLPRHPYIRPPPPLTNTPSSTPPAPLINSCSTVSSYQHPSPTTPPEILLSNVPSLSYS